jgi:predicted RND superfamily exporter protein
VAGTIAVSSDMIRAISHDGPRATLFAFIAVVTLTIVLFRNIRIISLVLFALFLGVIWLAGIILGFNLKINFLNFIALPITFGIGVDYGVNIFERYREAGDKNILKVIKNTGSAVGLCSFATIVGYTSLLIAGNQGFVSFGLLAVAGEITCVIAAIVALPSYLLLRNRRQEKKANLKNSSELNSDHQMNPHHQTR